jgi:hypothetical protein
MSKLNLLFLLLFLIYSCNDNTTNNTIDIKDKPTGTMYFEGPDNYEGIFQITGPAFTTLKLLKSGTAPNFMSDSSLIYIDSSQIRRIDKSFKNPTVLLSIGGPPKSYRSGFERLDVSEKYGKMAFQGSATSIGMVFVVNMNGDLLLTAASDKTGEGYQNPRFTSDGRLLMSGWTNNPGIYAMDLGSGNISKLGGTLNDAKFPIISPDGSKIAFSMNNNIYFMNSDGTGVTQKTFEIYEKTQPVWSPDGKWIACHDYSNALYFFQTNGALNFKIENKSLTYVGFPGYYSGKICWVQ